MKKILFIENDFDFGGRQRVSIDLLNRLVSTGKYDVDLCLLFEGGALDSQIPPTVNRVNIFDISPEKVRNIINECDARHSLFINIKRGHMLRAVKILFNRKYRKNRALRYEELLSHIKQDHYDYVVASSITVVILLAIASRVNADNRITWVHCAFCKLSDCKKFKLHRSVAANSIIHDVQLYGIFNKIVCVSKQIKELFDYYFPLLADRSIIAYNAMDVAKIRTLAEAEALDVLQAPIKIATVGRVEQEKGIAVAIEAAKNLVKRNKNFVWYFIGNGSILDKSRKSVERLGLSNNIVFLGARINPYPYIKACDIYCQPSLTEAYCTTVNEARILGKPVVATHFSGIDEQIIDGYDGLVSEIDGVALSEKLAELFDDNLRTRISSAVRYPNAQENELMFSVEKIFK